MSGWRGLAGGMAGLALLEVAVSNQQAAGRVGGVFDTAAHLLARWLDPNIPLIPDLRKGAANPFSGDNSPTPTASLPNYSTPRRLPAAPATPTQSVSA